MGLRARVGRQPHRRGELISIGPVASPVGHHNRGGHDLQNHRGSQQADAKPVVRRLAWVPWPAAASKTLNLWGDGVRQIAGPLGAQGRVVAERDGLEGSVDASYSTGATRWPTHSELRERRRRRRLHRVRAGVEDAAGAALARVGRACGGPLRRGPRGSAKNVCAFRASTCTIRAAASPLAAFIEFLRSELAVEKKASRARARPRAAVPASGSVAGSEPGACFYQRQAEFPLALG